MSKRIKNRIAERRNRRLKNKIEEKENKRIKIRKRGKKIILSTLTATMLVSGFPIHQSSTTVGKVFAEEQSKFIEPVSAEGKVLSEVQSEMTANIDKSSQKIKDKIKEILAGKNQDTAEREKELFSKIDELSEMSKNQINSSQDINEINTEIINKYENEAEKILNQLKERTAESGKVAAAGISGNNSRSAESSKTVNDDKSQNSATENNRLENSNSENNTAGKEEKNSLENNTAGKGKTAGNNSENTNPDKAQNSGSTEILNPALKIRRNIAGNIRNLSAVNQNPSDKTAGEKTAADKNANDDKKTAAEKLKEQKELAEKLKAKAIKKALEDKKRIRVGGKNRRETALGISRIKFNSSKKIILVGQDSFADSLTASVLAEKMDVPILLTDSRDISPEVLLEMQRLKTEEVLILGGEKSVSPKVEEKLKAMKVKVDRMAGKDRYETSAIVAEKVIEIAGNGRSAVIASGEDYPDALAIAPAAARDGKPILLVKKDYISPQISDILMYDSIKNITIVGGEKSVSKNIENRFQKADVTRIAGKDRYDTAEKIAEKEFKNPEGIYIATGENFADALTAGPVAGSSNYPILLVNRKGFTKEVKTYVDKSRAFALVFLGGENSVPKAFEDGLAKIGTEKMREEAAKKLEAAKKSLLEQIGKIPAMKDEEKAAYEKQINDADGDDLKEISAKLKKLSDAIKKQEAVKAAAEKTEEKGKAENKNSESKSDKSSAAAENKSAENKSNQLTENK